MRPVSGSRAVLSFPVGVDAAIERWRGEIVGGRRVASADFCCPRKSVVGIEVSCYCWLLD